MSHNRLPATCRPYANYNYHRWNIGQYMDWHSHRYLQLIHVIEGSFEVDCGNGWEGILPGSVHILPPGFPHRLRSSGGHLQFGLNFTQAKDSRNLLAELLQRFMQPTKLRCALPLELAKKLQEPVYLHNSMEKLFLCHCLDDYCLRLLQNSMPDENEQKRQEILFMLEEHSSTSLRVEDFAQQINMSRTSLQRFSQENFGCGIHTLHEKIRIANAARLLLTSHQSIGECAYACGYPDIYAFSRSFKRIKGQAPSLFRKIALSDG